MLNHLLELRRRLFWIAAVFSSLFLLCFLFANHLYRIMVLPLTHVLPESDFLIATRITTPLFTPIQLAVQVALLATAPYALFHFWRFIEPGLYRYERQNIGWAIVVSVILFGTGALFCFFVVLPLMLKFFSQAVPGGVHFMPDMADAVEFIMRMLLLFGLCFQIPLICFLLVKLKLLEIQTLKAIRPYVIVSAFAIGMILTPPDVLSQVMLAIPLCCLYELGLLLAARRIKKVEHRVRIN